MFFLIWNIFLIFQNQRKKPGSGWIRKVCPDMDLKNGYRQVIFLGEKSHSSSQAGVMKIYSFSSVLKIPKFYSEIGKCIQVSKFWVQNLPRVFLFTSLLLLFCFRRYDHQERLTAMEAMEHAYFYPVVKDHGRISNISNSPTAGAGLGPMPAQVPSSPLLSPNSTPLPSSQQPQ